MRLNLRTRAILLCLMGIASNPVLWGQQKAQGPADVTVAKRDTASMTTAPSIPDAPAAAYQGSQYPTGNTSGSWRLGISLYGFFPGVHGTVGVLGHDASIHTSF